MAEEKFSILDWLSHEVLHEGTAESLCALLVAAVKAGVRLWRANLRGAYLNGAYLRGAYLRGADLRGAYLNGAYLRGAYLRGAYLRGAYLRGADLRGAYLNGAYLRGADLRGADLRGADLRGAYLRGADLRGADLEKGKTKINWRSHELVSEILWRAADNIDQKKLAALVGRQTDWCWDEWWKFQDPERCWALSVLAEWVVDGDDAPEQLRKLAKKADESQEPEKKEAVTA